METWGNKYFITKTLSKSLIFRDDEEKIKYVIKYVIWSSPPLK